MELLGHTKNAEYSSHKLPLSLVCHMPPETAGCTHSTLSCITPFKKRDSEICSDEFPELKVSKFVRAHHVIFLVILGAVNSERNVIFEYITICTYLILCVCTPKPSESQKCMQFCENLKSLSRFWRHDQDRHWANSKSAFELPLHETIVTPCANNWSLSSDVPGNKCF